MGLRIPTDLAAWHRATTARSRGPLGAVATARRRVIERGSGDQPSWTLTRWGPAPRVLIALDAASPTSVRALLDPLAHLDPRQVAVLAPTRLVDSPAVIDALTRTEGDRHSRATTPEEVSAELADVAVVLSTGHYLPVGEFGHRLALANAGTYLTVQHGLLTPFAPPLATGTRLLAFSEADGQFWRSGRADVTVEPVGSQLLHRSARSAPADRGDPQTAGGREPPLLYLGQLHAAELPRRDLAAAARAFCLAHGAVYRPHPSEHDLVSTLVHRWWRRRGIDIDEHGPPLEESRSPVVSVFSTGVLEAAARGLPAWVDHPDPPPWLIEFWQRYSMSRFGSDPTLLQADLLGGYGGADDGDRSPAAAVASVVTGQI